MLLFLLPEKGPRAAKIRPEVDRCWLLRVSFMLRTQKLGLQNGGRWRQVVDSSGLTVLYN